MYLLSGKSLTKADWFRPERMALNLEERKSTATLTLGPEAPEIQMGAWLLDDEEPGAGIVWRVKTVNIQYDTETRTVTLEHIANALKDLILFGETKPTDMRAQGSTAPAGKCYAAEALAYILSKHSMFTLGTVAAAYSSVSNPYNFNGENLFTALETVTGSLSDCYWSFDLSAIPFTISFLQLGSDVDSEMRMGRNITTLRKTVDTSRMYTRFYPIGKDDLHITGNYVSRNENTYGVIEKVETDQSKTTAEELTAWANERLSRHAEPNVTITISGLDLSEATGEPLDHFVINKKCRVPLPEFNTTITEKVTKLSWSDKIGAPEAVTATLANLTEDLASIINNANKASSKGGRTSAKQSKDDHAWFVDTEDHVAMIAEAVGGSVIKDGQVVNWSRVASLVVDGEGIHQRVTAAAGDATLSKSWIEQNESAILQGVQDASGASSWINQNGTSILQGVQDATGAKSWVDQNGSSVTAGVAKISTLEEKDVELEGRLDLAAGQASLLVTATDNRPIKSYAKVADFPETGSASYLYYSLANKKYYEWTNGAYSETTPGNTINRAGLIATINEDGTSTTKILGNKILIGGAGSSVALSDVLAISNNVAHFKKNVYFEKEVTIANSNDAKLNLYTLNFVGANTYTLTPPDVANMIAKASVDGNTLKLWKYSEKNETEPSLTFSRATSLSGAWSGRIFTVTASPQGNTKSGIVYNTLVPDTSIPVSKSGKNVKRTFIVYSDDGEGNADQILFRDEVSISADSVYTDGYNDGRPSSGTAGGRTSGVSALVHDFTITKGDGTTATLQIDVSSIYATARDGYYTAAQYNANYTTGYNAGAPNNVSLGTKVTGTIWNVSATRGDNTTFADTLDLASVYTDARSGYYTAAQYNSYGTTQYNSGYEAGWKAGWDAFYDDSVDWAKDWSEGNNTYSVWTPKKNASYDYYNSAYGRGKGNGSTTTSAEWFRYSTSGGGHNNAVQFTRGADASGGQGTAYYYTAIVGNNITRGASTFNFYY